MADEPQTDQASHDAANALCIKCRYPLVGLRESRCPECGTQFDPKYLQVPHLPWESRRAIGWIRGYLKTLWLVFWDRKTPIRWLDGPMDCRSARRFHVWTILLVTLAAFPLIGLAGFNFVAVFGKTYGAILTIVTGLAVPCSLLALTGAGSYFCLDRKLDPVRQSRLLALWHYQTPLVLLFVVICILAQFSYFLLTVYSALPVTIIITWIIFFLLALRFFLQIIKPICHAARGSFGTALRIFLATVTSIAATMFIATSLIGSALLLVLMHRSFVLNSAV